MPRTASDIKTKAWTASEAENERKRRIASAAELLFSRQDFDAVSIRDIAGAAKVNSALVGYYFGTKDQLYRTIFERRYHSITKTRIEGLDALVIVPGSRESVRSIVRVWTMPLLELASDPDGRDFAALLARQSYASADGLGVWAEYLEPSARRCLAALREALPEAVADDVVQGYLWMIAIVMSCIARTERERRLSSMTKATLPLPIQHATRLATYVTHGFMAIVDSPSS